MSTIKMEPKPLAIEDTIIKLIEIGNIDATGDKASISGLVKNKIDGYFLL